MTSEKARPQPNLPRRRPKGSAKTPERDEKKSSARGRLPGLGGDSQNRPDKDAAKDRRRSGSSRKSIIINPGERSPEELIPRGATDSVHRIEVRPSRRSRTNNGSMPPELRAFFGDGADDASPSAENHRRGILVLTDDIVALASIIKSIRSLAAGRGLEMLVVSGLRELSGRRDLRRFSYVLVDEKISWKQEALTILGKKGSTRLAYKDFADFRRYAGGNEPESSRRDGERPRRYGLSESG